MTRRHISTIDAAMAGAFALLCLLCLLRGDWVLAGADATIALLLTRPRR